MLFLLRVSRSLGRTGSTDFDAMEGSCTWSILPVPYADSSAGIAVIWPISDADVLGAPRVALLVLSGLSDGLGIRIRAPNLQTTSDVTHCDTSIPAAALVTVLRPSNSSPVHKTLSRRPPRLCLSLL
jgi:hypothetical protein